MNLLRREGAEVHVASAAFTLGSVAGRAPATTSSGSISRTAAIVETLLGLQFYAPENPRPYDDTGWAIPLVRNVKTQRIDDKAIFDKPMTLAAADFKIAGTITGTGRVLIVDHTTDNTLVTFRFQHEDVKMSAAEQRVRGRRPPVRARRVRHRRRQPRGARAVDQGARPVGVGGRRRAERADARPRRAAHRLRPHLDEHAGRRLGAPGVRQLQGAVHLLRRAEAAGRQPAREVRRHHLPARRAGRHRARSPAACRAAEPRPYKKTELTPNVGTVDSTDDMRGCIGVEGLMELYKFVRGGRRAHHRRGHVHGVPRVQPHAGRHGRDARQPLRARLGAEDDARRQGAARSSTATTRTRWRSTSTRRR